MNNRIIMIDVPETFVSWCKSYGEGVKLQKKGAAIIMEYLSEHGKMLSTNETGELFLNSDNLTQKTTVDEVVDQVCEWNYMLRADNRDRKENPVDFLDYCRSSNRERELEEQKFILDRIYRQTMYGREIKTIAHNMALEMMKEMNLVPTGGITREEETGIYGRVEDKESEYATKDENLPEIKKEIVDVEAVSEDIKDTLPGSKDPEEISDPGRSR